MSSLQQQAQGWAGCSLMPLGTQAFPLSSAGHAECAALLFMLLFMVTVSAGAPGNLSVLKTRKGKRQS